jgi:tetratricopeptide (TPR) repeat protein
MLGNILARGGDMEAARSMLRSAIDMDPYLVQAWVPYLHALLTLNDMETLATELTEARQRLPDDVAVRSLEGVLFSMRQDYEAAEPILLAALQERPDLPFCNLAMATVRRAQGRAEEAEGFLEEEIRLYSTLGARYQLVEILAEQKRYEEQLEQLRVIASQEPPNFLTHHSLAQALYNLQRFPEAETEVDACLALAPTYPACAMLRANTLKRLGREAEALAAYQRALELGGETTSPEATPARP